MWFPEIFKRVEDGGGSTCTGAKHTFHNITTNLTCLESVAQERNLYIESFLVAISNIPGNILTVLIVNRVGRRPLMGNKLLYFVFVFSQEGLKKWDGNIPKI